MTGLLPKKHADFDLFKKQMLPKMALKGGSKADPAEMFMKMDKDGDGCEIGLFSIVLPRNWPVFHRCCRNLPSRSRLILGRCWQRSLEGRIQRSARHAARPREQKIK